MPHSDTSLILLSFSSDHGRFSIRQDEEKRDLFTLTIRETHKEPITLGHYRSINDAISAVSNQETGFLVWDRLSSKDVPHRVHDITSWKFEDFFGTNTNKLCS